MATQYSACRGDSGPVSVRSCSARAVVNWEAFPGLEAGAIGEKARTNDGAAHLAPAPNKQAAEGQAKGEAAKGCRRHGVELWSRSPVEAWDVRGKRDWLRLRLEVSAKVC